MCIINFYLFTYLNVHYNESLIPYKMTGSYCLENSQTCIVSHIMFTTYVRNVYIQRERKRTFLACSVCSVKTM